MKLKAIDHITINMKDIEKSLDFYGRVLGLEKLNEVDMGNHYIRYYALPGGTKLELIEYYFDNAVVDCTETDLGMYRHFALEVEDIEEAAEELRKEGIKITSEPARSDALGCYFMLFEDPNGCQIEFVQRF